MEDELFSIAIFNPGSDTVSGQRTSQVIWGRTGNDFLVGYQPPNPNPDQPQIDILIGDFVVDDPAFRQWNDTFVLGDWQEPYYDNGNPDIFGLNDFAVIFDFNPAQDSIQLYGSEDDYQVVDTAIGSAILYEEPTGLDVISIVLGASDLSLEEDYFQFTGTTPPPGPTLPLVKQSGTSGFDAGRAVATDPFGNVYVAGGTTGSIGEPNAGLTDGFVTKYDSEGNELFSIQLGSSGYEEIFGISTDNEGNVYVAGLTDSELGGPMQSEQFDAFVAKYDSSGNLLWIQQVGQNVQFPTFTLVVDAQTGDVFITGPDVNSSIENPDDAYVIKFDTDGNQQWITEIGTSGFANFDESYGITVGDDGSVYITGWTNGDLGGPNQGLYDNWVAKFDNETGELQWVTQYGTSDYDWAWDVATDSQGNVYTTGWTLGSLEGENAGSYDAYLTKFDSQGNLLWIQQMGSTGDDEARSIHIDANDNVYITGYTTSDLGGENAGSFDAWVAAYDTNGNQLWITQFGGPDRDNGVSLTSDDDGNLYVTGDTQGSLGDVNAGSSDGWVAKIDKETGTLLEFDGDDSNDDSNTDSAIATAEQETIQTNTDNNDDIATAEQETTQTSTDNNDDIATAEQETTQTSTDNNDDIATAEQGTTQTSTDNNDDIATTEQGTTQTFVSNNDSLADDDIDTTNNDATDNLIGGNGGNILVGAFGGDIFTGDTGNNQFGNETYTGSGDAIAYFDSTSQAIDLNQLGQILTAYGYSSSTSFSDDVPFEQIGSNLTAQIDPNDDVTSTISNTLDSLPSFLASGSSAGYSLV